MYMTGIAAFVLFFINDINDWKLKKRWIGMSFIAGAFLLAVSAVWMCVLGSGHAVLSGIPAAAVWIVCAAAMAGEIYSLFFSFSCDEAYMGADSPEERYPSTGRMYALCRHPGVLFFIIIYAGLILVTNMSPAGGALMCTINLLLILFEDTAVFPAIFREYDRYKQETPFLIPNMRSIRKCIVDFRR